MVTKLNTSKFAHLRKNEILVPHLNAWLARGEFPDEIPIKIGMNKEKDDAFHPSSATKCSRQLYAEMTGDLIDGKPTAEQQLTFSIGHMYHGFIQWILVEGLGFCTWDDIEKEHDLKFTTQNGNPYRVRGFIDCARCVVPNRGTYLVDVKTMNTRLFAQDNLPASTHERYEAQVQIYLEFEDLDEAIILCVSKDSPHRFKEVIVHRDTDFVERTMDRWEDVVDAMASGEIPDCTCFDPSSCPTRKLYDNNGIIAG